MSSMTRQLGHPHHRSNQITNGNSKVAPITEGALRRFLGETLTAAMVGMACMDPVAAAWIASSRAQNRSPQPGYRRG